MANALILHGTNGSPCAHWFSWLASELKKHGYDDVRVPELPRADRPNRERYWAALQEFPYGPETVIVGHSSGATMALRILELLRPEQRVRCVAAVAPFYRDDGFGCDELVEAPFAWDVMRRQAQEIVVFGSPDDPFVSLEQVEHIAAQLHITPLIRAGSGHFSTDHGGARFRRFPDLLGVLVDSAARSDSSVQREPLNVSTQDVALPEVQVTRATPSDLAVVVDVYSRSFVPMVKGYHPDADAAIFDAGNLTAMWKKLLDVEPVFVARHSPEADPVAILALKYTGRDDIIELAKLFVVPEAQGTGVARAVADFALKFAIEEGFDAMELWTWQISHQSRRFYEKVGFVLADETGISGYPGVRAADDVTVRYVKQLH